MIIIPYYIKFVKSFSSVYAILENKALGHIFIADKRYG